MRKRVLIGLAALLVAAGGTFAAIWYRDQTETKVVRGSPSVEFVTTEKPGEKTRTKKAVRRVPWPTYGYDAARTHVAADFTHRPPYRTLWFVETGYFIEFPPVVAHGRLFVSNQRGDFLAIRTERGRVTWRKRFRSCIAAGPAVSRGVVYQPVMNPLPCARTNRTTQPGYVVAMDAETGRERWRFNAGVMESSPLVVGNVVYVGSWDERVYALDARTGKLRWRASSFARFGKREYFYATPTVAYGRVYIGNTDGTLYAFGARTGNLLWAQTAGTYVYSAAAVWKNRVYVGSYDGYFSAFDAATGDRVWRWEAPGAIHGAPTVMAGLVYFSTTFGTATSKAQRYVKAGKRGTYALDAETGRLVWRRLNVGQYSPIVADEERVYLTGATRVYGLEPKKRG